MANKIKFNKSDDEISSFGASNTDEDEREEERNLKKKLNQNRRPRETGKKQIYRFDDNSDEDDNDDPENDNEIVMNDSDIEDNNYDGDIPDAKAWGKKRAAYYGTSFVDPDFDTYTARDEEMAYEEEEEAKAIQTRLAQELNDADFSLDVYGQQPADDDDLDEMVTKTIKLKSDLNDLSKRQKLQLFHREAPEFQGLVDDFQNGIEEAHEKLSPLMEYAKKHNLIHIPAFQMIFTKYKITLNYITNIAFYFLLKSNRTEIKNHPIIKRLVQQRKLLLQLNEKYDICLKDKMNQLLQLITSGEEIKILSQKETKFDLHEVENSAEFAAEEDELEGELESRRPITYQISKNKGLTPHRKKELRNPRVKHRNKFKKALVRRKGAVRTVRTENKRYGGELFGIKATVKKGIKIKS